ncbi:hypothetical protein [Streptomyces sp. NPDC093991]
MTDHEYLILVTLRKQFFGGWRSAVVAAVIAARAAATDQPAG